MRAAKWVLYGVLGLLGVAILGALALTALVDPNRFQQQIAAVVRDATGRELALEGRLGWSFFPRLAVSVGPGALRNAPGFDGAPLLHWRDIAFGARLWPLLSGRFELDRIRIGEPRLTLRRTAGGVANWSGFGPRRAADGSSAWQLELAGIDVRSGRIEFIDDTDGTRLLAEDLNLTTGSWRAGAPLALEGELVLQLSPTAVRLPLRLSAPQIQWDTKASRLQAAPLELAIAGGVARVAVRDLDLDFSGDAPTGGAKLSMAPTSLRRLLRACDIDPPETRDATALESVALEGVLQLDALGLRLRPLRLQIDGATIDGELQWSRADEVIDFTLRSAALDLGRYAEPEDTKSEPFKFPLERLRALRARGVLSIERATYDDVQMQGLELRLKLDDAP